MSVDNYRTIIDEIEQKHLDMESIRNLSSIVCKSPARTVEGKAIKIKEVRGTTRYPASFKFRMLTHNFRGLNPKRRRQRNITQTGRHIFDG